MNQARAISLNFGNGDLWSEIPVAGGMRAGISLALAGNMSFSSHDFLRHRAQFLSGPGLSRGLLVGPHQVHSRAVLTVDKQRPEDVAGIEADGLITVNPNAVLTILVADCLPIFLFDRTTSAFGLVHSGWKGTGIVIEALRAMAERFDTRPSEVAVTIGPGIGTCCYRVPEDRAARFAAEFGPQAVVRDTEGNPSLDLRQANVALLNGAGVMEIAVVDECTCCSPAFGSFRRQGPSEITLMLAYIGRQDSSTVETVTRE
jgi:polyphenol oxidase